MRKTVVFLGTLLIIIIILSFSFWLYEARIFTGRATPPRADFSQENSYVFVSPLRARANGQELIRLTIFILNNQGLGVPGKLVELKNTQELNVQTIKGNSDEYGRAVFDISSADSGEFYISIEVEDQELDQRAHLSFY